MNKVALVAFFLCIVLGLSAFSGCAIAIGTHRCRPSCAHGQTATLTVGVDEESVKEYGPVNVYIDTHFQGHVISERDYKLKPGYHTIRLERTGLPTYRIQHKLSAGMPILIFAPSKP